jgi:hypothetical protein
MVDRCVLVSIGCSPSVGLARSRRHRAHGRHPAPGCVDLGGVDAPSMSSPVPAVAVGCRSFAIVQDPAVVQALLAHGGGARSPAAPGPAPPARAAIG